MSRTIMQFSKQAIMILSLWVMGFQAYATVCEGEGEGETRSMAATSSSSSSSSSSCSRSSAFSHHGSTTASSTSGSSSSSAFSSIANQDPASADTGSRIGFLSQHTFNLKYSIHNIDSHDMDNLHFTGLEAVGDLVCIVTHNRKKSNSFTTGNYALLFDATHLNGSEFSNSYLGSVDIPSRIDCATMFKPQGHSLLTLLALGDGAIGCVHFGQGAAQGHRMIHSTSNYA